MIYTQFGEKVEVVGGNIKAGTVIFKGQDGIENQGYVGYLRADGGAQEINAAIKKAKASP